MIQHNVGLLHNTRAQWGRNSPRKKQKLTTEIDTNCEYRPFCPNPSYEQDSVAIIGDSILQGIGCIRNAAVRSYRGDNLEDLAKHVRAGRMTCIYGMKAIIVHAGTNDLYNSTTEQILQDVRRLFEDAYWNPTAKLCFSGIIPRPKDFHTTQFKIFDINTELQKKQQEWDFKYIRTHRIFMRYGLPIQVMYRTEGNDHLHPSDVRTIFMRYYYAKQIAILRNELGFAKMKRHATTTVVTKKPSKGYNYWGARKRRKIMKKCERDINEGPTYKPNWMKKEQHQPRTEKKKRRRPKNRNQKRHQRRRCKKNKGKNNNIPVLMDRRKVVLKEDRQNTEPTLEDQRVVIYGSTDTGASGALYNPNPAARRN